MKVEIDLDKLKDILAFLQEATNERCWNCKHLCGDFTGNYQCKQPPNSCQVQCWRKILEETKTYRYK